MLLFVELYWINPQFSVTLNKADDGDKDGKCTLVVSLIQKDEDLKFDLYISFAIFKVSVIYYSSF